MPSIPCGNISQPDEQNLPNLGTSSPRSTDLVVEPATRPSFLPTHILLKPTHPFVAIIHSLYIDRTACILFLWERPRSHLVGEYTAVYLGRYLGLGRSASFRVPVPLDVAILTPSAMPGLNSDLSCVILPSVSDDLLLVLSTYYK